MDEYERNSRLLDLLAKMLKEKDIRNLELLATMVNNDTEAMKMSFKIMTEPTPIRYFLDAMNQKENNETD